MIAVLAFGMSAGSYHDVSAADYTLNSDDFVVPEYGTTLVYYWYEGLPPKDGKTYKVLITWDDKFYIKADNTLICSP